ncbi:MAG: hypothetical protein ACYCOR_13725 [Acidobacteriaceae bacterium]
MTIIRDARGRFQRLAHDPANPWVLIDDTLREPTIRTACRAKCRYWQRIGGGRIMRTHPDRRTK